jgi:hypothetical protein
MAELNFADAIRARAILSGVDKSNTNADSEGWRSAFRSDGDQYSEVMSISNPN